MSNVLLIEDEAYWQDLICHALPEYDVAQAQSYQEAVTLLTGPDTYDVAIVDLNLLTGNDGLGAKLLKIMRADYPVTRRIALTGSPPTAVRSLFEDYEIDDLLLKENMVLEVVRTVVETALKRVAGDVPTTVRAQQAEIRHSVLDWKTTILLRLDQLMRTRRNDILEAELAGKKAARSEQELNALEARKRDVEARFAEMMTRIAGIRNERDLASARREFRAVQRAFEP